MKKAMMALAVLLLAGVGFWYYQIGWTEKFVLQFNELQLTERQKVSMPPVLNEINQRSAALQNYQADVTLVLRYKNQVKVRGSVCLDKPKNFRMELNSLVGKELDIGSNETHFWYWSRRDREPGLHFARHEDMQKTRLKTPFNPNWLMNCLGGTSIDLTGATFDIYNEYYRVIKKAPAPNGKTITVCTLIHPTYKLVIGRYLYDENNLLIASSEWKEWEYSNGLPVPKSITMIWSEQGIYLNWYFSSPRINQSIDKNKWLMPNLTPMIDMGKS